MNRIILAFASTGLLFLHTSATFSQESIPPVVGSWDLEVQGASGAFPSWFEVKVSGYRTLVGSFVGQFGSARPIAKIDWEKGEFRFAIPPQYENRKTDMVFEGKVEGDTIRGETTDENGKTLSFSGKRAPSLKRDKKPEWDAPIELFNGKDLTGWKSRFNGKANGFEVRDGVLVNAKPGMDIVSEKEFTDFKLRAEFKVPKGSNSGIYLRGRYEFQIEDGYGLDPESHRIGGVYGYIEPSSNASKPAGEWQTVEITLIGRTVSATLNGEVIIDRQRIPGITGGAISSNEGAPGPLMIQGDHGVVEFRKITLTPAK